MVLYELIGIVRSGNVSEVKEIARTAGSTILRHGGVVRGISNWGVFLLPKPIHKHQAKHHVGHHFIMRFDGNVAAQTDMKRTIALDPRVLRYSLVKLGDTLSQIKDIPGQAEWSVPYGENKDQDYEEQVQEFQKLAWKRFEEVRRKESRDAPDDAFPSESSWASPASRGGPGSSAPGF